MKNIPPHLRDVICDFCKTYYHVQCSGISKASFLLLKQKGEHWKCFDCMANVLPFSHIDNNELFLEMENKTELIDTTPSFTIQSLLDKMPGQNFETDKFMSESISSKYFTPSEFL